MVLNKRYNKFLIIIFILAGIFICQYLLFLKIIDFGDFRQGFYQREYLNSLYLELLLAGLFVPILEELGFRLYLNSSKKTIAVGVTIFSTLTIFNFYNDLYLLILFLIIGIAVAYLPLISKRKNLIIQLVLSSILFSLFHFIQSTIPLLGFISLFLYFLGTGLLFGIIRIKFGISYSIIAHILWNSGFILFGLLSLNNTVNTFKCDDYTIEYSESSIFSKDKNTISSNTNYFKLENGEIIQSMKIYFPSSEIKNYYQINSSVNYNINLINLGDMELQIENVINCLVEENLIKKIE